MTIAYEHGAAETAPLASALKERHVAMIALGGVIGAGLFVGSSAAILAAGPAVLVSYAIAGAIVFLVMRMLGEMAVARPGLGSFNAYIRAALGPRAAFVSAWLYWYFWIIAVGAETIAGAALLHDWIALPVWMIGLVLIALLTATNLMSVKAYGEFEFWFSLVKVLAIAAFILVAGSYLGLLTLHGTAPFATLVGSGGLLPKGFAAVLGAVPTVIFSLTGSEIASIAAAESDDPPGNVAKASRTVALRITIFYLLAIALIVATVPWSSLHSGQSPFVAAMAKIGHSRRGDHDAGDHPRRGLVLPQLGALRLLAHLVRARRCRRRTARARRGRRRESADAGDPARQRRRLPRRDRLGAVARARVRLPARDIGVGDPRRLHPRVPGADRRPASARRSGRDAGLPDVAVPVAQLGRDRRHLRDLRHHGLPAGPARPAPRQRRRRRAGGGGGLAAWARRALASLNPNFARGTDAPI